MLRCGEPGCKNEAIECRLPDGVRQAYCSDHAGKHGFCKYCGDFWGGVESFEFLHPDICDNCQSQIELEDERMRAEYADPGEEYEDDFFAWDYDR